MQSVEGFVSQPGIEFCADKLAMTSAEVSAVATFYTMFKRTPTGEYLVSVCTNTLCGLLGGDDIYASLSETLGIGMNETSPDGVITLEHAECQAACTEAPCLQVNYRYRYRVTNADLDTLLDQLQSGALDAELPPHGTLATVRQRIPADRGVGPRDPDDVTTPPPWIPPPPPEGSGS